MKQSENTNKPQLDHLSIVDKERYVRAWQARNPRAKVVPWIVYKEAGFYVG